MPAAHAAIPAHLRARVQAWLDDEIDPDDAAEIQGMLASADANGLSERFTGTLRFGTAGLRAPMRAGPNGMNRAVVRRTTAGVATWLHAHGRAGGTIVVGYDARHRSAQFARETAGVFAAAGFDTRLLPRALPTPVLAFAARKLGAAAAVMVTASHNPPGDNGYKLYDCDGAQIIPPADDEIENAIRAARGAKDIPLSLDRYTTADDSLVASYVSAVAGLLAPGGRRLRVVYSALHGVGSDVLGAVFTTAGFARPIPVPEQDRPDPDFPTTAYPNPEQPGALDRAIALARSREADLVIANDPDADRCAVAVPTEGTWRVLTGNELGVLLADSQLRQAVHGTYATTIVSSSLLAAMTARHGEGYAQTATGFKWIMRAADDLVFGYEEALGYAVAPDLVRDKDGISAALLVADLADRLTRAGSTLLDRLEALAAEYGRHVTMQVVRDLGSAQEARDRMARLRADPPSSFLGRSLTINDLADTDALAVAAPGVRVVIRPSGTEPKLKAYLELVGEQNEAAARAQLSALATEVATWLDHPTPSP